MRRRARKKIAPAPGYAARLLRGGITAAMKSYDARRRCGCARWLRSHATRSDAVIALRRQAPLPRQIVRR